MRLPFSGVADRIDLEANTVRETQLAPQSRQHDYLLGIDIRAFEPERLDVELMKLPVPSLLRPLVPEHRAGEPYTLRTLIQQIVFDCRAHDAGGGLGAQRQTVAVQSVLEC